MTRTVRWFSITPWKSALFLGVTMGWYKDYTGCLILNLFRWSVVIGPHYAPTHSWPKRKS